MKTLVLTEKPDNAKDMAVGLGVGTQDCGGFFTSDEFVITWTYGHLVSINTPEMYDPRYKKWTITQLPIIPDKFQYHITARNKSQFNIIKGLIHQTDIHKIILATDAGREGELIGRLVLQQAGNTKEVLRFWTSAAWTPKTIQKEFQKLRPIKASDPQYYAALGRQRADWLVGINASRAVTIQARMPGETHSLGRVKTPTLAMIARRQFRIDDFESKEFFTLKSRFAWAGNAKEYLAGWVGSSTAQLPEDDEGIEAQEEEQTGLRIEREGAANAIVNRICPHGMAPVPMKNGKRILPLDSDEGDPITGVVVNVKRSKKKTPPPYLFSLATLQQEANRLFGFSLDKTDRLAQVLYQKYKVISYPRSESQVLGEEVASEVYKIVSGLRDSGCKFDPEKVNIDVTNKRVFNDNRLVEDHHAIIPNGNVSTNLKANEQKLYNLIVKRFLAALYPSYEYTSLQILTKVASELFRTTKTIVLSGGWKEFYMGEIKSTGEKDQIDHLKRGESIRLKYLQISKSKTHPPPPYTDASLVHDMIHAAKFVEEEEVKSILRSANGIGTPATRSQIVKSLVDKGYVSRKGKNIHPTPKARALILALGDEPIASPGWTAYWEDRLTRIAEEEGGTLQDFMQEIEGQVRQIVDDARTISADVLDYGEVIGKCPDCEGGDVREKDNRYLCRNHPRCRFVFYKKQLAKAGKAEIHSEEMVLLLKGERIPLEGLKNKQGKTFNAFGALEKDKKFGWQVSFSWDSKEKGKNQKTESNQAGSTKECCVGLAATGTVRPGLYSPRVLTLTAQSLIETLDIEPQGKETEKRVVTVICEAGVPLMKGRFIHELKESGLLNGQDVSNKLESPMDVLRVAYEVVCEYWIESHNYGPRLYENKKVRFQEGDEWQEGVVYSADKTTGTYLIEVTNEDTLVSCHWEKAYCLDCDKPGIGFDP